MSKGTDRVKRSPEEIEREIGHMRGRMSPMLDELARRRRRLTSWRSRLRGVRGALRTGAAVVAGATAVARFVRNRRARRALNR